MSFDFLTTSAQGSGLRTDSPTPLYFQLFSLLKHNIVNGNLENGARIPTELELSESFQISRITAKRALDELAAQGLVERRRAKGTHVTYQYDPKPLKAPLNGMLQDLEVMGKNTDAKVIEFRHARPTPFISKEFELGADTTLLKMTRVRSRSNEAFGYYQSWSRGLENFHDKAALQQLTRLEIFKNYEVQIKHVEQTLTAKAANAEEALELGVEVNFPLLSLIRRSYDEQDRLVDFLQASYHPDRFQYRMDLTIEP